MSQVSTFTLCSSSILVLPQADAAHLHYCISVYLDAVILRQCYTGSLLLHTAQIQSLQSFRLGNYLMFTTESPSKYQVGYVLVESLSQCVVQGYHSLPAFLFYVLPLKKLTKNVCVWGGRYTCLHTCGSQTIWESFILLPFRFWGALATKYLYPLNHFPGHCFWW